MEDSSRKLERIPAYRRITQDLRDRIERGEWAQGVFLPSRENLSKEYGVALLTIQRAVSELLADGTLRADRRRGTFVSRVPQRPVNGEPQSPSYPTHAVEADTKFQSSSHARLPLARKPVTIGIVADVSPGTFNWSNFILRNLEHSLSVAGHRSMVVNINLEAGTRQTVLEAVETLAADGVDAIVVVLVYGDQAAINGMMAMEQTFDRLPVICITWEDLRISSPVIYYDSRHAGYQAARHLIRSGRTSLYFLRTYSTEWVKGRQEGIQKAVLEAGLPPDALVVYPDSPPEHEFDSESMEKLSRRISVSFLQDVLPTANVRPERIGVIAMNDNFAHLFLEEAAAMKLRPYADFAIVGFDDDPNSSLIGLTTLRPPLEAMAEEAARQVLSALTGGGVKTKTCIRSQLILRKSTRLP